MVKIGDQIMVKVMEIDGQGRINLSRKAVLPGAESSADDTAYVPRGPRPDGGGRNGAGGGPRARRPRE